MLLRRHFKVNARDFKSGGFSQKSTKRIGGGLPSAVTTPQKNVLFFFVARYIDLGRMDIDNWYRRYGESVYRRMMRYTRDENRAWDLTQEVFLRALRYQRSYRGDSKPLTWLFKIGDRCFFDSIGKPEPVSTDEVQLFVDAEIGADEAVFENCDLVARLISRAPKDVRQIVLHRYFDELDLKQIASRLRINERTVRRKLEKFIENARKFAKPSMA